MGIFSEKRGKLSTAFPVFEFWGNIIYEVCDGIGR